MTNPHSIDALESRAAEQRRNLHQSVEDLRGAFRERLNVNANARRYMLPASGALAAIGMGLGWIVAGLFFSSRNGR